MAQTPSNHDSCEAILRAVRRHQRLTKRVGHEGASALAARLDAPASLLAERVQQRDAARRAVGDAFDDWVQDDRRLDGFVEALERKCDDHDADNPGQSTHALVFGSRTSSEIRNTRREDEPAEVEKLIARGAALATAHPAQPVLVQLTTAAARSRASHRAYLDALAAVAPLEGTAEQSKLAVVALYRDNVHDLLRMLGDELGEECFPVLRDRSERAAKKAEPTT